MPIFAHIDNEASVQENDKTRIDVSKTVISVNEAGGYSYLAVQAGLDATQIDVYNTDPNKRYLDWEFDFTIDIDSTNNKIDFNEGGSTLTATITSDTYTLSTLATEIQTQLNSVGSHSYTVTVNEDDKIAISADGVFSLVMDGPNKHVLLTSQLYFDEDSLSGAQSYTSERVERLSKKLTVYAGEDRPQVQTITCVANSSAVLQNRYFFIWSAIDAVKYYVWFNSDSAGSDPSISGATGVQVNITSGDTAAQVASAVASALDALAAFSSSSLAAVVTVTNSANGFATTAREGLLTGFEFEVLTYGQTQVTDSSHIFVYSELGDNLFSDDSELQQLEPDIRRFVANGRNTFKDVHRMAQTKILEQLDREGFVNIYEEKFTKWDLVDTSEVREWARYMVLRLIFEGIKNIRDDVFTQKRDSYSAQEVVARQRAILRIDTDKDGELLIGEGFDNNSISLYFR